MQRRGTFNGLAMAAPSFTAFAMALVAVAGSARSAPDSAGESAMSVPASALWANACTYCHDTGVAPPTGGGFEIRLRDYAFQPGEDPTLVLRGSEQNLTFSRVSASDRFYIRMYDGSTPPNYSEFSTALFINLPLSG